VAGPDIVPFDSSHLGGAAELLAARHRAHRRAEPLLDVAYEEPASTRAVIAAAIDVDGASGVAAVSGERVVGYLLGQPKGDVWGPNMWVENAGQAVENPELVRDLYAAAAQKWVDDGAIAHYTLVPAHDMALVDAWFRLGFGLQHVHGICEAVQTTVDPPAGVTIRRAVRADIESLAQLDLVLTNHQGKAPTFSSGHLTTYEEALEEWREGIDDERFATFVAEMNHRVLGSAIGCSIDASSMHKGLAHPENGGFLGFAAVFPEARGHGVGRALGATVQRWAYESGYRSNVTDWRATNLLSSRTWPKLGYRPSFFRLHRVVGH
jgi:GNAT superfamily N-acetyltransferase